MCLLNEFSVDVLKPLDRQPVVDTRRQGFDSVEPDR
jgi:hypothetical protein